MSEKFEDFKQRLDEGAAEIVEPVEPSASEVRNAIDDTAAQMNDAEYLAMGERPLAEIIEEMKAEGWRYREPASHEGIYKAITEEGREIKIIGTGGQRYIFEK